VVLDACSDGSESIARRHPVSVLPIQARKVGVARALGADQLLAQGARWLAFTDADTQVAPTGWWRSCRLQADAVCGTVMPDDWRGHPPEVQHRFARDYLDRDDIATSTAPISGLRASLCACGRLPPCPATRMWRWSRPAGHGRPYRLECPSACEHQHPAQSKARGGFGDTLRQWAAEECPGTGAVSSARLSLPRTTC
jgi:hypothetical protein